MSDHLTNHFRNYIFRLNDIASTFDYAPVVKLTDDMIKCFQDGRRIFICGNGGSAANAGHIANDLLYPATKEFGKGLKVYALTANSAIVTCLANDEGYASTFSYQLAVHAEAGDILIALSGSGNSENILDAINTARSIGLKSYAILGFSGGKAKSLVDVPIHFPIDDMQISEDLQTIVFHMVTQAFFEWYGKQR